MMSEKRFTFEYDDGQWGVPLFYDDDKKLSFDDVVALLNSLSDENEQLRQTIKEMQQDEELYANEIVKLNKEAKEVLNFKNLGGDY